MARYVELKHKDSTFSDLETKFSITRDEVKLLPEKLSLKIKDWLNAGGLIFCDAPEGDPPVVGDEQVADPVDLPVKLVAQEPEDEVEEEEPEEKPEIAEEKVKTFKPRGRPRKKA